MLRISFALFLTLSLLAGCNDRSRGRGPGGDASADTSITVDTGPVDPRCSESPFTFMSCGSSQAGVSCPGTVSCECGPQPTTCVCDEDTDLGFAWQCTDLCDCTMPSDSGTDTLPPPTASCGAAFDQLNASSCPFPAVLTRDAFIESCESTRATSELCRMQMDAILVCTLTADIECLDAGDGFIIPNPVGCPTLDESCTAV